MGMILWWEQRWWWGELQEPLVKGETHAGHTETPVHMEWLPGPHKDRSLNGLLRGGIVGGYFLEAA